MTGHPETGAVLMKTGKEFISKPAATPRRFFRDFRKKIGTNKEFVVSFNADPVF